MRGGGRACGGRAIAWQPHFRKAKHAPPSTTCNASNSFPCMKLQNQCSRSRRLVPPPAATHSNTMHSQKEWSKRHPGSGAPRCALLLAPCRIYRHVGLLCLLQTQLLRMQMGRVWSTHYQTPASSASRSRLLAPIYSTHRSIAQHIYSIFAM